MNKHETKSTGDLQRKYSNKEGRFIDISTTDQQPTCNMGLEEIAFKGAAAAGSIISSTKAAGYREVSAAAMEEVRSGSSTCDPGTTSSSANSSASSVPGAVKVENEKTENKLEAKKTKSHRAKKSNLKQQQKQKSHSRESSGASVKFVVNGKRSPDSSTRRNRLTGGSLDESEFVNNNNMNNSDDTRVIIVTEKDLKQQQKEDDDEDLFDDEDLDSLEDDADLEDEENHRLLSSSREEEDEDAAGEGRDEGELRDRLGMLPPGDSKSQNSDYGSFCNTPSDNFSHNVVHHHQSHANNASNTEVPERKSDTRDPKNKAGEGSAGGEGGGGAGAPEGPDAEQQKRLKGEDKSVMSNESRGLLEDEASSDDEVNARHRGVIIPGSSNNGYVRRISRRPPPSAETVQIDIETDSVDNNNMAEIPKEGHKTLMAFVFLFCAWVATTTSLALTHERVPEVPPLPDVFLDNVQYQSWGLDASEIIIIVMAWTAFALSVFHQHRYVVLRRIFLLGGIHYFYRGITFFITVLPKADPSYACLPKLDTITFLEIAKRVLKLLSGMGLSINGQHVYCGDYIYSGHTMTLIMTYLVIKEYSPRRWFLLRWFSFIMTVFGIVTLLLGRGHYSVDCVIAYYITTRLWWLYHSLATNPKLTAPDNKYNYFANIWWYPIFTYFERGVGGRVLPKGYNWPLPDCVQRLPVIRTITGYQQAASNTGTNNDEDVENGGSSAAAGANNSDSVRPSATMTTMTRVEEEEENGGGQHQSSRSRRSS